MTEEANPIKPVAIDKILKLLPHRYPFLLVDKVIDYKLGEYLTAVKNVTFNEPYFAGHFPGHPVMPGVFIIEAMAQASGILSRLAIGEIKHEDEIFYLVKVDKAKFMQTVGPGDQLLLHTSIHKKMRNMVKYICQASVAGKIVAKAEILCASKN
ncbi:MAG: 3-hydroxyacyl-ACP dehydratase FabZ [Proteobacteria bacterium]|nr:3-hydroxyacyl-ACP dehydratase FabZ [Pseudomonadota bacterium]